MYPSEALASCQPCSGLTNSYHFLRTTLYDRLFDSIEPVLGLIFPRSVNSGEDMYVWQFLAAIGIGASPDQQQRLVMGVK